MGRLAEAEGEAEIYRDLRMKLFIDPADMKAQYQKSPEWLKKLMNAWADGLNYYLYKHPGGEAARDHAVRAVDGADLQRGQHRRRHRDGEPEPARGLLRQDAAEGDAAGRLDRFVEPTGSNGAAIAPSNTTAHHALLLINPHTSFYFRAEAQMTSDEGLNAYGALTWGQFFIYQGFNERAGWMHTSSGVDNIDEYLETVTKKGRRLHVPLRHRRSAGDGEQDQRALQDGDAEWPTGNLQSTGRITGRSCAKPTASGSASA